VGVSVMGTFILQVLVFKKTNTISPFIKKMYVYESYIKMVLELFSMKQITTAPQLCHHLHK